MSWIPLACALALSPPLAPTSEGALVERLPAPTEAFWAWTPDGDSEPLSAAVQRVLDTVQAGHFDTWILDGLEQAGAPAEFVIELRSVRNVVATVVSQVPWDDLLSGEFVLARGRSTPRTAATTAHDDTLGDSERASVAAAGDDRAAPGALLLCRPASAAAHAELRRAIPALMGTLAGMALGPVRYDIGPHPALGTQAWQLTLRDSPPRTLLTFAELDDVLLLAFGDEYLNATAPLLRGTGGPRLLDAPHFVAARADLGEPTGAQGLLWFDPAAGEHESQQEWLQARSLGAGPWGPARHEWVALTQALDHVAVEWHATDSRLTTRRVLAFDPGADSGLWTTLPQPCRARLLDSVPADVATLTLRGAVDLGPAWRQVLDQLEQRWGVLWLLESAQAAMDLWVERDVLPWLGAEHLTITMPDPDRPSAPEATQFVTLFALRDANGARSCMRRIDGVLGRLLPRLDSRLTAWAEQNEFPYPLGIELAPGEGFARGLSVLHVQAGPVDLPPLTYGVLGNRLIVTTSEKALARCMAVAAGEEDGLAEHPLLAEMLERDDLTHLELSQPGEELRQTAQGLAVLEGMLRSATAPLAAEWPQFGVLLAHLGEGRQRMDAVLQSCDFLGAALTLETIEDGGRLRRETSVQTLRLSPAPTAAGPR